MEWNDVIFIKNGVITTEISWEAPTERTDGAAYTAVDHAGYELGVANAQGVFQPWVSVPAAYHITSWPLNHLNITTEGQHAVALRTVDTGGRVSVWSNPLLLTAMAVAAPNSPTDLSVIFDDGRRIQPPFLYQKTLN